MKLKRWETALAIGFAIAVIFSLAPLNTQAALSEKMTRLHIIPNSDGAKDQQLKLFVRDRILEASEGFGAAEVTDGMLRELESVAEAAVREAGFDYGVRATRQRMYFDTRDYETFSLPAGYYDAVRIEIGEAEGKNWWCVLFPPLCNGVCEEDLSDAARQAGLTDEEIAFIREDGTVYVIRFKLAELWGKIQRLFS